MRHGRGLGLRVLDCCNLTILDEPGQDDVAEFLAEQGVEVIASLPCYLRENVDAQRGAGVFEASLAALRRLNALGYGDPASGLILDLVYNPQGPSLPLSQEGLEADYRRVLLETYGIRFNPLLALANLPIGRFGSALLSQGLFHPYLKELKGAHREESAAAVICRELVSVDWRGLLYDCDFNQQIGLPLGFGTHSEPGAGLDAGPMNLRDLTAGALRGAPIAVADHCCGCTARQGSSCGGALGP